MKSQFLTWRPAVPAILISALALTACSSPPPTAALTRAKTAIDSAQLEGAEQLAPAQLQSAQQKYANANAAVGQKDMDQAKDLAEEAEMEGIYAEQLSMTQKTENVQAALANRNPAFKKGLGEEKIQRPTQ